VDVQDVGTCLGEDAAEDGADEVGAVRFGERSEPPVVDQLDDRQAVALPGGDAEMRAGGIVLRAQDAHVVPSSQLPRQTQRIELGARPMARKEVVDDMQDPQAHCPPSLGPFRVKRLSYNDLKDSGSDGRHPWMLLDPQSLRAASPAVSRNSSSIRRKPAVSSRRKGRRRARSARTRGKPRSAAAYAFTVKTARCATPRSRARREAAPRPETTPTAARASRASVDAGLSRTTLHGNTLSNTHTRLRST